MTCMCICINVDGICDDVGDGILLGGLCGGWLLVGGCC